LEGETRFYNYMQDKINVVVDLYEDEEIEEGEFNRNNFLMITNKKGPSAT